MGKREGEWWRQQRAHATTHSNEKHPPPSPLPAPSLSLPKRTQPTPSNKQNSYTTATTLNPDGSVMFPRLCPWGPCPPPHNLTVTPHTDVLAANPGQLANGGCFQPSKMVIWTARQGCRCYAPQATNCTGVAGAARQLPDARVPAALQRRRRRARRRLLEGGGGSEEEEEGRPPFAWLDAEA